MMRIVALLLTLFLCAPAFAQMQKVLVADFRFQNQADNPVKFGNNRMLEVFGFGIGVAGGSGIGRADATKAEGYTVKLENKTLECRGQAVIGVSTPFVHEIVLNKRTNDYADHLTINLASPYNHNQTVGVLRETRYPLIETSPAAKTLVEALENKYGEPHQIQMNTLGFPASMRWNFRGATMLQSFIYHDTKPGIVSFAKTELFRSIRGSPAPFHGEEQRTICDQTRPVDQAYVKKLNERNQTGPKL